jgi:putative thioredoxin
MTYFRASFKDFKTSVLDTSSQHLVVLDISTTWCAPCKRLDPITTKVAKEYDEEKMLLVKLEAEDENMKIAGRYKVRGFPTVIAFIRGKEVDRFYSAQTPDFVHHFIDTNLEKF